MINRVLIRIKVVQMFYNYMLTQGIKSIENARKELEQSFDKSYELYNYLLKLIIDLTDLQERYIDDAKHKFMPSHEDLNPNPKFIDNELVEILRNNVQLAEYIDSHKLTWRDNEIFLKLLLNKIQNSDFYHEYMESGISNLESDCNVWRQIMRRIIIDDEDMLEELENQSIYWSCEDLEFMGQYVIKTIKRVADGDENPIMPQFKDQEDSEFGDLLFTASAKQEELNMSTIDKFIDSRHWDSDRIALIDRAILLVALAEVRNFENIPTTVTLNEYIEIAKSFSSPNSAAFVNGVLHSAIMSMRNNGIITKQ
ncbi:MAG: transcription antitermination protein NusB [Muribaculaceae bacterium]|nr:transcription antitermination protein NusB [Muribaculaceae bacterium]